MSEERALFLPLNFLDSIDLSESKKQKVTLLL